MLSWYHFGLVIKFMRLWFVGDENIFEKCLCLNCWSCSQVEYCSMTQVAQVKPNRFVLIIVTILCCLNDRLVVEATWCMN